MNSSFRPFAPRTRNSLMTSCPAVAVTLGNGAPVTFVDSPAGGNPLLGCEAGAAAGVEEVVSRVAGADAVELLDRTFTCVVTGAANIAGTGIVICFDEAVLALRRFGRFLPAAVTSTQTARMIATTVTAIVSRNF